MFTVFDYLHALYGNVKGYLHSRIYFKRVILTPILLFKRRDLRHLRHDYAH